MPDITPAGQLSTAVYALQTLLANLAWFKTWTSTSTEAQARARAIIGPLYAASEPARPFVTIGDSDLKIYRKGAGDKTYCGIGLIIGVHGQVAAEYKADGRNAVLSMANDFGQFAENLLIGAASPTYLLGKEITARIMPTFEAVESEDDATVKFGKWYGELEFSWGAK